ncbi:hypothetical protein OSH08_18375 [Kaistia geumhonensis]|uniref:Uncharacterized protein n=1 Tax=Kaistia geumhonensis TaxID=410839 RepID=A0ABU0MAN6_9HYPH|nr:hypothetical protein [Kaistia geumhonensis]MCX5480972.1 hypothetical protein [Kaistia geumhonensis]MDQ0518029.1 hypothetical protein [Kaistia geumhonensis]
MTLSRRRLDDRLPTVFRGCAPGHDNSTLRELFPASGDVIFPIAPECIVFTFHFAYMWEVELVDEHCYGLRAFADLLFQIRELSRPVARRGDDQLCRFERISSWLPEQ